MDVGIRLQSEDWRSAYANTASIEYKRLRSKLLSAVSFLKCLTQSAAALGPCDVLLHNNGISQS